MSNHNQVVHSTQKSPLSALAARLSVDEQAIQNIVLNTLVSAKKGQNPTNEEFVTFLAIANEYKLNPLTKEVYAFANRGTVQVIVSIDGWLKIINSHPQIDGFETVENFNAQGQLESVTCSIYRKDRTRPTSVTEYLNECKGTSEPWIKWPARMLRHKALIQCARYAFGLALLDEDEAERIKSTEKDVTPRNEVAQVSQELPAYPEADFNENIGKWAELINGGKDPQFIVNAVSSKYRLTEAQTSAILSLKEAQ